MQRSIVCLLVCVACQRPPVTPIDNPTGPTGNTATTRTLTVTVQGPGSVASTPASIACPGACALTADQGSVIVLTATANTGAALTGWSVAGCSGNTCAVTLGDADASVTATFASVHALTVTVTGVGQGTVTSDVGGIACTRAGGTCTSAIVENQSVTLTATPAAGYVFAGWRRSCDSGDACTFAMGSARTVAAVFAPVVLESNRSLSVVNGVTPNNQTNIFVAKADGSGVTALTIEATIANVYNRSPQWSPDGEKIVFESNMPVVPTGVANATSNVWIMDGDGANSNRHPLTDKMNAGASSHGAMWSPDGSKIAFSSQRAFTPATDGANANNVINLWIMNADGTNQHALTTNDASQTESYLQGFSPDGQHIVYVSRRDPGGLNQTSMSGRHIWRMTIDGNNDTRLTHTTEASVTYAHVKYSPDGSKLAFVSNRGVDGLPGSTSPVNNLWIMGGDGSNPTALTTLTQADVTDLEWTPDGSAIVYASNRRLDGQQSGTDAARNLWAIRPDGSNNHHITQLQTSGANTDTTGFNRSGTKIYYGSNRKLDGSDALETGGTMNIFSLDVASGAVQPLTTSTGNALLHHYSSRGWPVSR